MLQWSPIVDGDVPGLVRLGEACLERDGGLPDLADADHMRSTYVTEVSLCGRDTLGDIVAAAAMGFDAAGGRTVTALVDPAMMGHGIGHELADWVDQQAGGQLRFVMDSISPEAESLFAELGLRQVFAESIMRHSLRHIPVVKMPEDIVTLPFTDDTSEAFHHAYQESFRDQRGYDERSGRAWGRWLREQRGFAPEDSRVALDVAGHVAGFVTVSDGWIEEVGVVPAWRGRGLGAHLVARTLTAISKQGRGPAWLAVGSDNPARSLYERLGFRNHGRRGLYEERTPSTPSTPQEQ